MSTILVVCTGNICRSPVCEVVLAVLLPGGFRITSAGTHAAVARPASPEAVRFVKREINAELEHTGKQLTKEQAEAADLIITMTLEQRAWVARMAPRAVRRSFTLRELALIVGYPGLLEGRGTLRDIALAASRFRSQAGSEGEELDIADPYGGPPAGYETSFRAILVGSERIAEVLSSRTVEVPGTGPMHSRKVIPLRGLPDLSSGS